MIIEQPWGDDRLKIGDRYIGCVSKENADYIMGLQKRVAELEAALKEWDDNAKVLLDSYPYAVRSCYKGLEEDLLKSLCVTYIGMRDALKELESVHI